MLFDDDIDGIGEELNISDLKTNLANNVIPKSKEISKLSRRNTHFRRSKCVLA